MQVKGKIKFAGKNKNGYYTAVVAGHPKDIFIGFGVKKDTHDINGVTIQKDMIFEGEVDENNYNTFVSGKVYAAPTGSGSTSGGKSGGYDNIGMAMGGAVNRASEFVASNIVHPNAMITNALNQYMISEMCIAAVKTKRVKELNSIASNLDITSFDVVYQVFASFMANKTPEKQAQAPAPEPEPVKQAPAQQSTPENFGAGDSEFEDDIPF